MSLEKFPELSDKKYLRMMKFYSYEEAKEKIKTIVLDDKTKVRVVFMEDVQKWREKTKKQLQERLDDAKKGCKIMLSENRYNHQCLVLKFLDIFVEVLEALG